MKLAIVIPVYNEEKVIRGVINAIPKKIKGIDKIEIIAVNDGSTDKTNEQVGKTRAHLISHPINLGAGATTATGLEASRILRSDIVLTMDGDGQHDPKDIERIIRPILQKKADVVIGTRLKNSKGMPFYRKVGNIGLNIITLMLSGKWTSDSQSGFKAFTKKALCDISLDLNGYEFCSEIIMEASKNDLKVAEVPIRVIYSEYSKRKGQSFLNGFNIVIKLIYKKIIG